MNILLLSEMFSANYLSNIKGDHDGRNLWLLELLDYLNNIGEVHTSLKKISSNEIDLELHFNFQIPLTKAKRLLFYFEDMNVRPENFFTRFISYDKVFSFSKLPFLEEKNHHLAYPHDLIECHKSPLFSERIIDASMLATNRNVIFNNSNSLYNKRQSVIKFFERNASIKFNLYGKDWDQPFMKSGLFHRLTKEISKNFLNSSDERNIDYALKNWHGTAPNKHSILLKSKFNFCFENIYGLEGYISEKILDCFVCGTVPIYFPSFEIKDSILPKDLYYDFRDFEDEHALFHFIENFNESNYEIWISKVQEYLPVLKERHSSNTLIKEVDAVIQDLL